MSEEAEHNLPLPHPHQTPIASAPVRNIVINESVLQTEYKYCYDLVLHYVLHYLNKDQKEKK